MHPAVPLRIVVLVTDPSLESSPALARHGVKSRAPGAFLEAVEMPLAKPGGAVAAVVEGVRYRPNLRVELVLMTRDGLVRIAAGEKGAARWAAKGAIHQRVVEVDAAGG